MSAIFELVRTCGACPEQYDVYRDGVLVGYMRLRHGTFRVHRDGPSGDVVYEDHPWGDGTFRAYERDAFLRRGCEALLAVLPGTPLFTIREE